MYKQIRVLTNAASLDTEPGLAKARSRASMAPFEPATIVVMVALCLVQAALVLVQAALILVQAAVLLRATRLRTAANGALAGRATHPTGCPPDNQTW